MIVSTPISPGAISCASLARQSSTALVRYDIAVALKPAITVASGPASAAVSSSTIARTIGRVARNRSASTTDDRTSVVSGTRVAVVVDIGVSRIIKQKKQK